MSRNKKREKSERIFLVEIELTCWKSALVSIFQFHSSALKEHGEGG